MTLQYYLDTNAVQSLGLKLESISSEGVFTSIWTQIELVSAINDDDSYRRKKAALKHLSDSGIYVDQAIPAIKRLQAYTIVEPEPYEYTVFRERIIPIVLKTTKYDDFLEQTEKPILEKALKKLQEVDEVSRDFGDFITKYNNDVILNFANKWEGDKVKLIREAIEYHAGKIERRFFLSKSCLINEYDHSIDYFMLIHYFYVESKKHVHEKPARNDFNDILHLLYLKEGCKLVTDDKGFQKYVNKMVEGLAIGTEHFLDEINARQG